MQIQKNILLSCFKLNLLSENTDILLFQTSKAGLYKNPVYSTQISN